MKSDKYYIRKTKFPCKIIEDEAVIINIEENRVLNLKGAGAEIWGCLDTKKTIDEIVEDICLKFDVERNKAKKDTVKFLSLLLKEELIEEADED